VRDRTEHVEPSGSAGRERHRTVVRPTSTPPTKVLVLTTFDLDDYVHEARRAGPSGFFC